MAAPRQRSRSLRGNDAIDRRRERDQLLAVGPVVNHVHLLVNAANREELARAMNLLKGISARRLFEQFPDLKNDKELDHFWQHRYAAKEVSAGARKRVIEYIPTQDRRLEEFARW